MKRLSRRQLLAAAGSAAATAALAPYVHAWGHDKLKVGLIGCGGRGTGAAEDCLRSSPDVELVAIADLFPDRLAGCRKNLTDPNRDGGPLAVKLDDDHCFTGFDAYQKLLALDEIGLVLLATPPGFRPIHFAAAIEAGKHVFFEKPVAVDAWGAKKVIQFGEIAAKRGLGVVAGTQRRHQNSYLETMKRIHDGAIGEIVSARCGWNQGALWVHERKKNESDMEWQVRNWLYFCWLSGDHIVEQHVHNLDVCNWALKGHPVKAVGVGGRQVRTEPKYGHIFDHFTIDYEYAGGVHMTSMCRQQNGTDGWVGEQIIGTTGASDPGGSISGSSSWRFKGENPNPYVVEHRDLIVSIRDGKPLNEAGQVAESTLTAIMGREAAYTGRIVSWDSLLKADASLAPKSYEFGPLEVPAVPVPGRKAR